MGVKYLYAFSESGSIYQPVYLGKRNDIPAAECVTDQLKYKADADLSQSKPDSTFGKEPPEASPAHDTPNRDRGNTGPPWSIPK